MIRNNDESTKINTYDILQTMTGLHWKKVIYKYWFSSNIEKQI